MSSFPKDWYWIVGGDDNRAWSSAAGQYVTDYPLGSVTRILNEQELTDVLRVHGLARPLVSSADVNAERDRRMGVFTFGGKLYDLRPETGSLANVSGAGTLAFAAIMNGALPGDFRWADPDEDFTWIAEDNSVVAMDAPSVWAFAEAAAAWRKAMIFKARALKDMSPIPTDFATNESYWA